MLDRINESDWKIFKPVRQLALERFCERVLSEAERIRTDASKSQHERYVATYQLLKERDKELGRAFDYLRRSTALSQLAAFRSLGLVSDDEYMRFSAPTREVTDRFVNARSWSIAALRDA
jgi:hypothetical protein